MTSLELDYSVTVYCGLNEVSVKKTKLNIDLAGPSDHRRLGGKAYACMKSCAQMLRKVKRWADKKRHAQLLTADVETTQRLINTQAHKVWPHPHRGTVGARC